MRVLSTVGMLGYGYPTASLDTGASRAPHAIGADAGSTDAGPFKLATGRGIVSRQAARHDLERMILAGRRLGVPVLVGSTGGSGSDEGLAWTADLVREIAREHGLRFRLALVHAEIPRERVLVAFGAGRVHPFRSSPALDATEIEASLHVVAQMGAEPLVAALDAGADVIIAGRAYDPAIFAAPALRAGYPPGLAWHMGKILECGAQCAVPGSPGDCLLGSLHEDRFLLEPMNPERRCEPASVAAHTLYEKSHPYLLPGPGGTLDLSACEFRALDARRVEVRGSRFVPSDGYAVKLEGVKAAGYRTIAIAGVRDPLAIRALDLWLDGVRLAVMARFPGVNGGSESLSFRIYGRDAVLGALEPERETHAHEVGIIIDVLAPSQEQADAVCAYARSTMLHFDYPGRKANAGNLAFPYSPSDIPIGQVYTFNIYHLMDVDDPCELFPMELEEVA